MIRTGLLSILLGLGIVNVYSQDSIVSIPDTAFLNALIHVGVDSNGDSLISYEEGEAVTSLDVGMDSYSSRGNISNMTGIIAFINLESLDISILGGLRFLQTE